MNNREQETQTETTREGQEGAAMAKKEPTCYGQTITRNCAQEWYETASRDAGRRARALRKAGYRVFVESMGSQVTNVGRVKMTLVTILGDYDQLTSLPRVRIERGV